MSNDSGDALLKDARSSMRGVMRFPTPNEAHAANLFPLAHP